MKTTPFSTQPHRLSREIPSSGSAQLEASGGGGVAFALPAADAAGMFRSRAMGRTQNGVSSSDRRSRRERPQKDRDARWNTQENDRSAAMAEPKSDDVLPRVAAGDPGAVEECLDRYGGLVWSLARRHTRMRGEAEDAVQEIFLALWKNAGRFDRSKASSSP